MKPHGLILVGAVLLTLAACTDEPVVAPSTTPPTTSETGWSDHAIEQLDLQAPDKLLVYGFTCGQDLRVDVAETDSKVKLRLQTRGTQSGDCNETALVQLESALSGRTVVDATTDKEVPVRE